MTAPETLAAVVEAAVGRPLDSLTVTEALDVADRLRAVVDTLPATSSHDAHLAAQLIEAAVLVEHRAGVT